MPELFEAEALPINQPPTIEADLNLGTSLCKLPDPKMAYDANGCCLRVDYHVAIDENFWKIRKRIDQLTSELKFLDDPETMWKKYIFLFHMILKVVISLIRLMALCVTYSITGKPSK